MMMIVIIVYSYFIKLFYNFCYVEKGLDLKLELKMIKIKKKQLISN